LLKIHAFLSFSPKLGSLTNESKRTLVSPVSKFNSTIPISTIKPFSGFLFVVSISTTAIFFEASF
jgi:hypothetical protein